jgi:hypothetical protein
VSEICAKFGMSHLFCIITPVVVGYHMYLDISCLTWFVLFDFLTSKISNFGSLVLTNFSKHYTCHLCKTICVKGLITSGSIDLFHFILFYFF